MRHRRPPRGALPTRDREFRQYGPHCWVREYRHREEFDGCEDSTSGCVSLPITSSPLYLKSWCVDSFVLPRRVGAVGGWVAQFKLIQSIAGQTNGKLIGLFTLYRTEKFGDSSGKHAQSSRTVLIVGDSRNPSVNSWRANEARTSARSCGVSISLHHRPLMRTVFTSSVEAITLMTS